MTVCTCIQVYVCVLVYPYTGVSVRVHVHLTAHVRQRTTYGLFSHLLSTSLTEVSHCLETQCIAYKVCPASLVVHLSLSSQCSKFK